MYDIGFKKIIRGKSKKRLKFVDMNFLTNQQTICSFSTVWALITKKWDNLLTQKDPFWIAWIEIQYII